MVVNRASSKYFLRFEATKTVSLFESRRKMGILTFMLAVFAERPSLMLGTETGEIEGKVLCALASQEES
jgi:hypothetical protein